MFVLIMRLVKLSGNLPDFAIQAGKPGLHTQYYNDMYGGFPYPT